MKKKIQVYHFHNGSGGGVLSVIRNLVKFSNNPSIENHVIYTINKDVTPLYIFEPLEGAQSEQVFYYSPTWNFYHTCRQLAKLLPDDKAVVVAHDWIELGMMSNLGLQNPVVHILHGDYPYYYNLAQQHNFSIDMFIAVAASIKHKLALLIPERKENIKYRRFPVGLSSCAASDRSASIIFLGRCTEGKGYHLLPLIAQALQKKNTYLQWHIVGELNEKDKKKYAWDDTIEVIYYGSLPNDRVQELLCQMQFTILPSIAEGMPVSIAEAMKAGVIPLVNNIDGGIQELIKDGITGYKIINNNPELYAGYIYSLLRNEILSASISENCIEAANKLFDPYKNTRLIEEEICKLSFKSPKIKKAWKAYGSRFDKKWIPNLFTKSARSFR